MIPVTIAVLWLVLGLVAGLIAGRIISNADRDAREQQPERFGECDGAIPSFHAGDNA